MVERNLAKVDVVGSNPIIRSPTDKHRGCSSVVERNLAKVDVVGSNPIIRSQIRRPAHLGRSFFITNTLSALHVRLHYLTIGAHCGNILCTRRPRRSMDRTEVSGTSDVGSIPTGAITGSALQPHAAERIFLQKIQVEPHSRERILRRAPWVQSGRHRNGAARWKCE